MDAAIAQSGAASTRALLDSFSRDTSGGARCKRFIDSADASLWLLASLLLVPRAQA